MRSLILAGVPHSGKTRLARRLARERGLAHWPADALVSSFEAVYPKLGIGHRRDDHREACRAFLPWLSELFRHLRYEELSVVLDIYHLFPKDVALLREAAKIDVLFLGYPRVDTREKCAAIRRYARPQDWSEALSDEALALLIERYQRESEALRVECEKARLPFVDTGLAGDEELDRARTTLESP